VPHDGAGDRPAPQGHHPPRRLHELRPRSQAGDRVSDIVIVILAAAALVVAAIIHDALTGRK
jgi:hypothetical protein